MLISLCACGEISWNETREYLRPQTRGQSDPVYSGARFRQNQVLSVSNLSKSLYDV